MKKDEGFEVTASDKEVHQETYEALPGRAPEVEGIYGYDGIYKYDGISDVSVDGLSLEMQPVRACVSTVHGFTAAVS